ncbi:MAG: hypothetical protein HY716_03880 [Planctomycetes bacterium]|nr:hypothetical protein [Planctomycetota bacterium]
MTAVALVLAWTFLLQEKSADFFPHSQGTVWTYVSEGKEGKITVSGEEKVGDVETVVLTSERPDRLAEKEYLAIGDRGIRLVRRSIGDRVHDFDPPILRLKLPALQGESWEWKGRIGEEEARARFTNRGEEEVKVPAGTYKAWKVEVEMELAGTKHRGTNWYAPGIGIVRQEFTFEGPGKRQSGVIELKAFAPGKP